MLTSNVGEAMAFVRSSPDVSLPDLQLIFAPVEFIEHGLAPPPGHGVTCGVVLLQPESEGEITLVSSEPFGRRASSRATCPIRPARTSRCWSKGCAWPGRSWAVGRSRTP